MKYTGIKSDFFVEKIQNGLNSYSNKEKNTVLPFLNLNKYIFIKCIYYLLLWLLITNPAIVFGFAPQEDTLKISLADAEAQFFKYNYKLLAAKLNIDASKAANLQAKLLPNPNIQLEQNIYNKFTQRFFDVTKTGNTELQVQQLIVLVVKETNKSLLRK